MIDKVEVRIVNKSPNELPFYSTILSAGMDLRAWLKDSIELKPMDRALIPTGIYIELPPGYECQIRPRSGLAIKRGLTVLNSPGTIDADYRGEVCVILANMSNETQIIENGERICQMVVAKHSTVVWNQVEELSDTDRGSGGFGHTGTK
ncbi:MAG: dUTP diphosphatase [Muribaculaceae bacterium]|nr:dUTP diphosphatase [Muribaculaceae bacterium]